MIFQSIFCGDSLVAVWQIELQAVMSEKEGKIMEIGNKIRNLRVQKGLTQEELANRCELSKGFISQVERDLTSPSIATLTDILQCLGTNLEQFFSHAEEPQVVFHPEDFFEKVDLEKKNQIQWIVPNAQKNMMEPILVSLEAGGYLEKDSPHEGEEFGYVLSGSINITIESRTYQAKKGDSFYYAASKPHYIRAAGRYGAKFLWISTPPNF